MNEFNAVASAPGVFEKVLELLGKEGHGKSLIDAPAGAGILSNQLSERGFDVTPVDIEIHPDMKWKGKTLVHDLNQSLPLEDNSIDTFVSVEGIEHLESPTAFLRDIYRCLKKGGRCIVSTPNTFSIKSRYRYLTKGHHLHFDYDNSNRFKSGHMHFMDPVFLHRRFTDLGFTINGLHTNRYQDGLKYRFLAMLNKSKLKSNEYADCFSSKEALLGECLIFDLTK